MDIQSYLSKQYQGHQSFLENIIFPIFGEENYDTAWDVELLDSEELRNHAHRTGIRSVIRCGTINIALTPIEVFDITVADRVVMDKNRVSVQALIRRIMDTYSGAFMIIHYDNDAKWDWRFTFCQLKDKNEFTDSKRYTFLLGPNQSCKTAAQNFQKLADLQQEISIKDIQSAFDVEALSKEFFKKYKSHYERFVEYITGKRYVKESGKYEEKKIHEPHEEYYAAFDKNDKDIRDYVKLTLGRIILCHFIQKKGWLGVAEGCEWGKGDENFMHNLYLQATEEQRDDFLESILEPLFFEGLNKDRRNEGDIFNSCVFGNIRVPYLNGGLFEKKHSDEIKVKFPKEYFKELLDFFYEYNFTIDENDPNEAQVGIDPEMLSQIFENLLEDNKDKGAFYTPKEIVKYMCQESLIAYLTKETNLDEGLIRRFILNPDIAVNELSDNEKQIILNAILTVKICDPAIGSGAFPIGLLNELVRCKEAILGDTKGRADIKREIIRDNIYGVDIENGAVDIARLRFWLSIIVDEEVPEPLPNLDYKIMQGDSLLESYNGVDLSHLTDSNGDDIALNSVYADTYKSKLTELLEQYFDETNHDAKAILKDSIKKVITELLDIAGVDIPDGINIAENNRFFLWHTWFNEVFTRHSRSGFDIVIGNPPYLFLSGKGSPVRRLENEGKHKEAEEMQRLIDLYEKTYPEVSKGCKDFYKWFYKLAINICKESGILTYITPDTFFNMPKYKDLRTEIFKHKVTNLTDLGFSVFDAPTVSSAICIMVKDFSNSKTTTLSDIKSVLTKHNRTDIGQIALEHSNTIDIQDDNLQAFKHHIAERIYGSDNCENIGEHVSFVEGEHGIQIDKNSLMDNDGPNTLPVLIDCDMVRNGYVEKGYIQTTYNATNNLHCGERGILRKTGDTIFVSVPRDNEYAVAHQNVYIVKDKSSDKNKKSIYFWMGLLNSKLLSFLYQNGLYGQKGRTMAQFRIYALNALPLPKKTDSQLTDDIKSLSEKLVKIEDKHERTKIENEINQRVYKLYSLSTIDITEIEKIMSI